MTADPRHDPPCRRRLSGRRHEDGTYTAIIEIEHRGQFVPDEELSVIGGSAAEVRQLAIRCVKKHGPSLELPDWFPIVD